MKKNILEEERKKLSRSFSLVKKEIHFLLSNQKKIQEQILTLREPLREVTTRTTPRSSLKPIQKRVLKRFDDIKLMKAIASYLREGYTTNHIRDEIINKFEIKPTCFFKYFKLVREQLRGVTTRSNYAE